MPNALRRDTRKSPRRPGRHKVRLQQNICFTLNVGDGGFCVGILRVLPPGTAVEGTIDMNGTAVPFTGSVAWAEPGDSRLGMLGRMGVRFLKPQQADADEEVTTELPLRELDGR